MLVMVSVMTITTTVVVIGIKAIAAVTRARTSNTTIVLNVCASKTVTALEGAVHPITLGMVSVMMAITIVDVTGTKATAVEILARTNNMIIAVTASAWILLLCPSVLLGAVLPGTLRMVSATIQIITAVAVGMVVIAVATLVKINNLIIVVTAAVWTRTTHRLLTTAAPNAGHPITGEMVSAMTTTTTVDVAGMAAIVAVTRAKINNSITAPVAHVWIQTMHRLQVVPQIRPSSNNIYCILSFISSVCKYLHFEHSAMSKTWQHY